MRPCQVSVSASADACDRCPRCTDTNLRKNRNVRRVGAVPITRALSLGRHVPWHQDRFDLLEVSCDRFADLGYTVSLQLSADGVREICEGLS